MSKRKLNITPTTDILHSMSRAGYHWSQAVMDIMDNSVDALRERYNKTGKEDGFVMINTRSKTQSHGPLITTDIIIADNGTGIQDDKLQNILRLGLSGKRGQKSLGTFGMGLKTATMALGKKLCILTTTSNVGNLKSVTWDISNSLETGKWEASYEAKTSEDLKKLYLKYIGSDVPGTVVVIGNLNEVPTPGAIRQNIIKKCAHTYRHLLNKNSKLNKNFPFRIIPGGHKSALVPDNNDPLAIDDQSTSILVGGADGSFEEYDYQGTKFYVRMTRYRDHRAIPNVRGASSTHTAQARSRGLGEYLNGSHKQGVYWLREGREIYCGSFWRAEATLSNIFAEISFNDSGILGENPRIQMDFGKKGIVIDDGLREHINRMIFKPQLDAVKKRSKLVAKEAKKADRDQIMKSVSEVKLPSDKFGRARKEKKSSSAKAESIFSNPKKRKKTRVNSKYRGQSIKAGNSELQLEFEEYHWKGSRLPFDINYTAGDPICKIQINVSHPWIEKNIYLNKDNDEIAKNLYWIANSAISLMWEDEEVRHRVFEKQGDLMGIFDEDLGRVNKDLYKEEMIVVDIEEDAA